MQISQTDIQTNTSKVKFGTSQNRKRRVQWNKLPWTTQTHRTQPPDSPWPVGTRRSPWAPRSSPRSQCTRPRWAPPSARSRPTCTPASSRPRTWRWAAPARLCASGCSRASSARAASWSLRANSPDWSRHSGCCRRSGSRSRSRSRSRPPCASLAALGPCCPSRGSRPWSCARACPRPSAACWRRQSSLSGRWRCSWTGLSRAMIINHVKNG